MKRTVLFVMLLAVGLAVGASNSLAQNGTIAIERVDGLIDPVGFKVLAGQPVRFLIRATNDTPVRVGFANGYRVYVQGGGTWDSTSMDSIGPAGPNFLRTFMTIFASWEEYSADGIGDDTVGFQGAGNPGQQPPPGYDDTVYAITAWFDANDSTLHGQNLCIDSAFFGVGGEWLWAGEDLNAYYPEWVGLPGQTHVPGVGYCFLIWDQSQDVSDDSPLPKSYAVSQNYPNPFNPSTTIEYEVPRKSHVNLTVYNVLGQKVSTIVDKEMAPGRYKAEWDGRSDSGNQLASGIYFYKFDAGGFAKTKKMLMLK